MKLLLCAECGDIKKLQRTTRHCWCGKVSGRYVNDVRAEVSRDALVIGIGNGYLSQAIRKALAGAPDDVTTSHGSSGHRIDKVWVFSKSGAPNITWGE